MLSLSSSPILRFSLLRKLRYRSWLGSGAAIEARRAPAESEEERLLLLFERRRRQILNLNLLDLKTLLKTKQKDELLQRRRRLHAQVRAGHR